MGEAVRAPNGQPPLGQAGTASGSDSTTAKGQRGEQRACAYLERVHGYEIVERNHRNPRGEIDLVAWDRCAEEPVLCFIEIKARSHTYHGTAAEAVDRNKQSRIRRAAEVFLLDVEPTPDCRFDVVTLERVAPAEASSAGGGGGNDEEWRIELFRNAFS